MKKLNTLKNQVEAVLIDDPETRNSDIALTIGVWVRFYGVKMSIEVSQLYKLPREDNVKRIRAKFQNEENKYLPTSWEVAEKRGINERTWRRFMGYDIKKVMEQEKKPFPIGLQPNTLIKCPKCQGGMLKHPVRVEGEKEARQAVQCVECGHKL